MAAQKARIRLSGTSPTKLDDVLRAGKEDRREDRRKHFGACAFTDEAPGRTDQKEPER